MSRKHIVFVFWNFNEFYERRPSMKMDSLRCFYGWYRVRIHNLKMQLTVAPAWIRNEVSASLSDTQSQVDPFVRCYHLAHFFIFGRDHVRAHTSFVGKLLRKIVDMIRNNDTVEQCEKVTNLRRKTKVRTTRQNEQVVGRAMLRDTSESTDTLDWSKKCWVNRAGNWEVKCLLIGRNYVI